MPNTRQLTGAIVVLASIAVLDNFIFIEEEPRLDSMVRVDPADSGDADPNYPELQEFWVDRDKVKQGEFAAFLEATGYQAKVARHTEIVSVGIRTDGSTVTHTNSWQAQPGNSDWNSHKASIDDSAAHLLAGENDLLVNIEDAKAYCNWLGKELPSAEQYSLISTSEQTKDAGTIGFRCVTTN